jgi:cytochrome P450
MDTVLDTSDWLDPARAPVALAAAAKVAPTAVDPTTGMVWALRYEEIERLAHDPRLVGVGMTMFDVMGIDGELRRWYGSLMFTNEGDTHARLRRLVSRAFTPRAAARLRDETAQLANALLAPIDADGEGDLIAAFRSLSDRVMCRLLGVPEEDVAVFGAWAEALSPAFGFMDPDQIAAAQSALGELLDYVGRLVEKRHGDPRDDLITALLAAEDAGDRFDREEVVTMVANLLVGGHDTTTSQIGCTLLTVLRYPDAVAALQAGKVTAADVVSETMRYEPSIGGIPRTVREEVAVGDIVRSPGTLIVLSLQTGNRDAEIWESAESFVVDRFSDSSAPRLLSFGTGPHYCLGANLARMTLEEAVSGFSARDFSPVDDLDEIEWRQVLGRSPVVLNVRVM